MTATTSLTCRACGKAIYPRGTAPQDRPAGAVQSGARNMCNACYQRACVNGTLGSRPGTTGRLEPSPAGFTRASVVDEPLVYLSPDVARAAALQVCAHATGPDDARDLLGTLGLLQAVAA